MATGGRTYVSTFFPLTFAELIDQRPIGRLQITIIVLCSLVALLDGFDLLAIGVAAPAMAGPLHIAPLAGHSGSSGPD
jgi:MFS transporter, AAHS family, 4-hydroxybenzoate transporter